MKMTDYEWVDRGRRREQVLVMAMSKPRMPRECHEIIGCKKGNKLDVTLREFRYRGLVRLKAKGLYGLTERGQNLRKILLQEKGLPFSYSEPRIDWKTYVWVMLGIQRKSLLKVLQRYPIIAARLIRLARQIHARLSRTDTYRILNQFAERNLAESSRQEKYVLYSITRKGETIKKQMMMLWFALFLFV